MTQEMLGFISIKYIGISNNALDARKKEKRLKAPSHKIVNERSILC